MIALLFLAAAVVLAVIGSLLVWWRLKEPSPKRMSSIDSFRRGLDAISPGRRPPDSRGVSGGEQPAGPHLAEVPLAGPGAQLRPPDSSD